MVFYIEVIDKSELHMWFADVFCEVYVYLCYVLTQLPGFYIVKSL